MLFGLGSPGGIVNNQLIRANAGKDEVKLSSTLSNFGTNRLTFDYNKVLKDEVLAIRLAGLYSDKRYKQDPAYVDDRRWFGTVTYKPFGDSRTVVRANLEVAERESNKPRIDPPRDSYSWWWDIGQPTYDPTTGLVTLLGTPSEGYPSAQSSSGGPNGSVVRSQIGSWSTSVGLIVEDPNVQQFGITGTNAMAMEARNERVRLDGTSYKTDGMRSLQNSKRMLQILAGGSSDPTYSYWRDTQITDPNIFNFYEDMIDGPNKYEWAEWENFNFVVEQRLLDGKAGVELAYDWQYLDRGYVNPFQGSGYAVTLDINTKLSNGEENPNFLRPVIADSGWASYNGSDRKAFRATGFYDLNFEEFSEGWLAKLLGRHTVTGTFTEQEQFEESFGGRQAMLGLDHYASEAETFNGSLDINATNNRRALMSVVYLGPSVAGSDSVGSTSMQGLRVSNSPYGLSSVSVLNYQSPLNSASPRVLANWEVDSFSVIANQRGEIPATGSYSVGRSSSDIKSEVIVSQGRWWDDSLVSTVGWRRDTFSTYSAGSAAFDPATGMRITDPSVWSPELTLSDSVSTFNYGFVFHGPDSFQRLLPEGAQLSLTYNKSDNFRPTAQRFDILGSPIDSQSGTTEEYGALLSLFEGKLSLRVNHYKTSSALATNSAITNTKNRLIREIARVFDSNAAGNNADQPAALAAWDTWTQSAVAQQLFETFDYEFVYNTDGTVASTTHDDRVGEVFSTSDVVASGMEYEATINPTRNWRIAFNLAQQEAIRSNTARDYNQLMADLQPAWTGAAGDLKLNFEGSDTLADFFATNKAELDREVLLDGSPSPELREWRANFVTNYTFSEGKAKGFKVGGALRWQSESTIGFAVVDTAAGPQIDVSRPYHGSEETNADAWIGYRRKLANDKVTWNVKLSVKNIGVGDELIAVGAQPDGSIAAYRVAEPETWSLSNTFEF